MTPAERARQIDAEEFRRDSQAALARALEYSRQKQDAHRRQFLTFAFGEAGKTMATDKQHAPTHDDHTPQPVYTYKTRTMSVAHWATRLRTDEAILRRQANELGSMEAAIKYFSSKLKLRRPAQQITHNGETLTRKQWAERLGITKSALSARTRKHGFEAAIAIGSATPCTVSTAIARAARSVEAHVTHDGLTMTRKQWADHLGVSYNTLCQRIKRHGIANAIDSGGPKKCRKRSTSTTPVTAPGVSPNFHPLKETGARSAAQETSNITFSQEA